MSCFHPNICYVLRPIGEEKRVTKIKPLESYDSYFYEKRHLMHLHSTFIIDHHPTVCYVEKICLVPCGNCLGCSLDYSKDWSNRLKMEYLTHIEKDDLIPYFITLTYADEFLPKNKQLNYSHIEDIIKKLSDKVRYRYDINIRYFVAGEYGSKNGRPHFHMIVWVPP